MLILCLCSTGPPATSAKGQTVPVDEYDFVETPSADFFCPVLKDLLLQPHLTTCCGHHFSVEAADRIKTEGAPCPICKDPNFTTVLDKRFRRQVFELKVFCRHKTRGCKWVGELSAFEHHMESCPRQNSPIESHSSGMSSTHNVALLWQEGIYWPFSYIVIFVICVHSLRHH